MDEITPIFVFSLPRSGSTLFQRVLARHSSIETAAEPWLLLPQMYAQRATGIYTTYNHRLASEALSRFVSTLPAGQETYKSCSRRFVAQLYREASTPSARYFVDKTPRYHLIADDIIDLFPNARFIILWRHPLSVVASLLNTWRDGRWDLCEFRIDLYEGLSRLIELVRSRSCVIHTIRYEDFVMNPSDTIQAACHFIGVEFEETMLSRLGDVKFTDGFGDPTGQDIYEVISEAPLEKWKPLFCNHIRRRWASRYLRWIGSDRLDSMGYDLQGIMDELFDIELSFRHLLSDAIFAVKCGIWLFTEPRIVRDKLKVLRNWENIAGHY